LDKTKPTLKIFTHEIDLPEADPEVVIFRACDPVCKENYIGTRLNRPSAVFHEAASVNTFFCASCGRREDRDADPYSKIATESSKGLNERIAFPLD